MFAEDVGLIPHELFTNALRERWQPEPHRFTYELEGLWQNMDTGGSFGFDRVPRFNGALFKRRDVLRLNAEQIGRLLSAAKHDWSEVDPTIFGTLIERALNPVERHALGAHFTPRAWIERLVRPTVIEPLMERWGAVQAAAQLEAEAGHKAAQLAPLLPRDNAKEKRRVVDTERAARQKLDAAIALLKGFHNELSNIRVLDPACGSGNFLVVTFDLFKRIEAEVVQRLRDLGENQVGSALNVKGATVTPAQFLGIEKNPRAREIAELVLWIGYLQWYRRTNGSVRPPEPVLQAYGNIECRDAVLAYDAEELVLDERGKPATVWDMRSYKADPLTGKDVPDEAARVPLYRYTNARRAEWPEADYIVGNPPFVGNKRMRMAFGDGYAEALRAAWPDVPGSADFVMYWWAKAAELLRAGTLRRFGFITTNSITQVFNRAVLEAAMTDAKNPVRLIFAVADHPWVDEGAAVRIGMTAATLDPKAVAKLGRVVDERRGDDNVQLAIPMVDLIHADLRAGANVAGAVPLRANQGICFQGMNLVGKGFRLDPEEVEAFGYALNNLPDVIKPYSNARDLTQAGPRRYVIDLYGYTADEARERHPKLYQRLLEQVKPERDENKRKSRRERWWLFGEAVGALRAAMVGLRIVVLTPETSKHRIFSVQGLPFVPDHSLYALAFGVGDHGLAAVLTSRVHEVWALRAGARLGIGNDPRWRNKACFEPFPFPQLSEDQLGHLGVLLHKLGGARAGAQSRVPKAHLTAQYNALARAREAMAGGPPLTAAEQAFHQAAEIGVLRTLHDEIDKLVAEAYGWPVDLTDDELLDRLVALNKERAAEEAAGTIRWLRPDFQAPAAEQAPLDLGEPDDDAGEDEPEAAGPAIAAAQAPWPKDRIGQLMAVLGKLQGAERTPTASELAAGFKGAEVAEVEELLRALGATGVV